MSSKFLRTAALAFVLIPLIACGDSGGDGSGSEGFGSGATGGVGGGSTAGAGGASGAAGISGVGGAAGTNTAGTGAGIGAGGSSGAGVGGMGVGGAAGAGAGGAGGEAGTAGTGAGDGCVTRLLDTNSAECAECLCTMCGAELTGCLDDTSPSPNPNVSASSGAVCEAIVDCARETGCQGGECFCGCTEGEGCCGFSNYTNPGPCKTEIANGGSGNDFQGTQYPTEAEEMPGVGHPVGNATALGQCDMMKCAAVCGSGG